MKCTKNNLNFSLIIYEFIKCVMNVFLFQFASVFMLLSINYPIYLLTL